MRSILTMLALVLGLGAFGQVQSEDGTWHDDSLSFVVQSEQIKKFGELSICVYHIGKEMCIDNLVTPFEVLIYNENDNLLWTSMWTGMYTEMKFKKAFPSAKYVVIRSTRDFVININTGTRIYTGKPLELKYDVR
ncbi:hypothetical protein [Phaeocystidibacter marisrubri]|uniref:Uncharacterized protein n=1 Tax=Phaeocystidibacter marisrubri TaxID=1577780 RepID=A0A6L3ZI56_9FLAO|nr:hypothetical protein [Phaeocystidibacter marisrubri]KAB2816860.1 hypothetical protein F8C82_00235 [Phaeocystidibacter marisrubri]